MGLLQRIISALSPSTTPVPVPAPVLVNIGGAVIDLAGLGPQELLALEARLNAQAQAAEQQINANLQLLHQAQQQAADPDFATWLDALRLLFGPALAQLLSQQQVEPGMQIKHLVASFGPADEIKALGSRVRFVYGSEQTGSYFDIEGDTIVYAHIVNKPRPPVL